MVYRCSLIITTSHFTHHEPMTTSGFLLAGNMSTKIGDENGNGIQNMEEKVPSLKTGGVSWFTDLTTVDTSYILPFLSVFSFWLTVECHMPGGIMKNSARSLAVPMIPLCAGFPKMLFCYWITFKLFSLTYGQSFVKMAVLKEILPPAKSAAATFYDHSSDPWFKQRYSAQTQDEKAKFIKTNPIPVYNTLERLKYRPSKPQNFGDGGAFLEIYYAQYPLDMGRKKDSNSGQKTLPVTVDDKRNLRFDAIVKQNENSRKVVYSQHRDIIPKVLKDDDKEHDEEDDDKQNEIEETTEQTKAALEKIVNVRLSAVQPKNVQTQSQESQFINYKPSQQSDAYNSGSKGRIIRMMEMPVDPLEPPKFKHKRVPKANGQTFDPLFLFLLQSMVWLSYFLTAIGGVVVWFLSKYGGGGLVSAFFFPGIDLALDTNYWNKTCYDE
ncbi:chromatin protein family [Artemisia annua]|uniref:Chromatin protein family n=1 Tax=Artemisia annua TaxID=35608 RepID=A0A2U1NB99_ARTAN|nr:chromatin protein family [Artemisia annua]